MTEVRNQNSEVGGERKIRGRKSETGVNILDFSDFSAEHGLFYVVKLIKVQAPLLKMNLSSFV